MTFSQKIKRIILHIFWAFPIKKNRIAFLCYGCAQYSCNPKYISIQLEQLYGSKFEHIWFYNTDALKEHLPDYVKKYKKNSPAYFYMLLTSEYIITNVTLPRVTPFREKQIRINTWHGTAFKGDTNKFANNYNENNYFIAENRLTHDVFRVKESFNYQGEILDIGMPRNDILLQGDPELVLKIKKKLHLEEDAKVALYAPTFRDSGKSDCFNIDFKALEGALHNKFGGNWIVLCRYHHMQVSKKVNKNIINVSDYPDMQELLLVTDVLITDYSSCMWDFSLMKRPVFLYAEDIEDYIKNERGKFYFPLGKLPFSTAKNNAQLSDVICNFNGRQYISDVAAYHSEMGRFNYKATATDDLIKLIVKNK